MTAELKSQSQARSMGGEQNLIVALRIRPMAEDEIISGAHPAAYKVENNMVVLLDPADDPDDILRANRSREKQFVFDCTFDGACTQRDVYEATTKVLIPNVTVGYNATVFAYGPTGAGKTYTMLGTDEEPGIMVQALNDLFLEMRQNTDKAFKVTMSYLEIYNEMIRDLLNPDSGFLELREDARGNVQVAGISEVTAKSTEEVMGMLIKGNLERTQEPTAANATSSRSHAILQVTVKQRSRVKSVMQEVKTGRLFLVDLAGSERAANTHNRGKRMVEGAHINRSLLALGNCINALSDKSGPKYINYRDSKLTRLLKDALGGNCKTVMIAHISPASSQFEESRNTLVYADRAKHIKTKVRRNVTDVAYHIAQYSNIISELRDEIMRLRSKLTDQSNQRQSVANIQAVQSEVVESQRRSDRAELTHFKEQLLTSFKDQIELRRTLMELNNASMEISLETNRNQLVISEYEVDTARRIRNREHSTLTDNKYLEEEKENEAPEGEAVPTVEPVEVRVARDELQVLHDEKHKTERVKATIRRELDTAREKTSKLEEMIPVRISSADQQEILQLLCKVHQLEIASLEGQAAGLLRDFQLRHKDMVITRLQHWRSLADDIITRQRQMLEEHKVEKSAELAKLYELYADEQSSGKVKADDISSFSSIDKIASFSNLHNHSATPKTNEDADYEDSNKVFTRSAKAKQIARAEEFGRLQASDLNLHATGLGDGGDGLLEGGLPLGLGTSSVSPSRFNVAPSRISYEDRNVINANTRNIAALAARKRNQAGIVAARPLYRPLEDDDFDDFGAIALTPSRLAQHNRYMEWGVTAGGAAGQFEDTEIESSLPPVRTIGTVGSRRLQEQEEARRRAVRYGANGNNGGAVGYLEKSRNQARRLDQHKNQAQRGRGRRKVPPNNNMALRPGKVPDDASTVRSGSPNTISSEKARRTSNGHGGRGKRATSIPNNQWDKNSVSSTPQARERRSNVNKVLPTIPQYRKGDIAITGTATGATRF